jgi:hypothetical protein
MLLNCPRKLKKILISIFLNILCQTAKKIALRAIVALSARGGRSAEKNLKRFDVIVRGRLVTQIGHNLEI